MIFRELTDILNKLKVETYTLVAQNRVYCMMTVINKYYKMNAIIKVNFEDLSKHTNTIINLEDREKATTHKKRGK